MKIEVYPDDDTVAREAAAVIADDMRARRDGARALHHGGERRPHPVADAARVWPTSRCRGQQVHVLFRWTNGSRPPDDPERNLTHLRASLLTRAPLPPEQIHAMPVEATDSRARGGAIRPRHCGSRRLAAACSTSFISASDRTATPLRWCPEIRPSTSPMPTSR